MKKVYESEKTHKVAAFICGLCLLFIMLLTATQALCYWIPDWWRNEYAKYDTPSNVNGEMSLDDAVSVTEDMLEYCIGRRDTLDDSMATINGVSVPFFTDREKSHLADCRELFLGAVRGRVIAALLFAGLLLFIYIHNGKQQTLRLMAGGYLKALAAVMTAALAVAALALKNFTFVFTEFHHIFFDNDLWILYPEKDNLINIMQEDVFADAAAGIGLIFGASALILAAAAVIALRCTLDLRCTTRDS